MIKYIKHKKLAFVKRAISSESIFTNYFFIGYLAIISLRGIKPQISSSKILVYLNYFR